MTKNAIAFVYKRSVVKSEAEEDGSEIKLLLYTPYDIVIGFENNDFNKRTFFTDEDTQLAYIEDMMDIDEELVYAFPYYTTNVSKDKQYQLADDLFEEFESIEDYNLFQFYSNADKKLSTIATKNDLVTYLPVEPSDFTGIRTMRSENYLPLRTLLEKENLLPPNYNDFVIKGSERKSTKVAKQPIKLLSTNELFNEITKTVICQDEQIKSIVTGFAKNQRIIAALEKNPELRNTLVEAKQTFFICGPTGVGKTAIFRALQDCAKVPISYEDATRYTMEGYVGESPEQVLKNLIREAGNDIEAAQRGIIVIDEIDKKALSAQVSPAATKEVQASFLTMMTGQKYPINISNDANTKKIISFDTSTITFAFLGAYSGIEEFSKINNSSIGFSAENKSGDPYLEDDNIYSPKNLMKYGMLAEFIGRGNIITLNSLNNVDSMIKIMLESNKSAATVNRLLYQLIGINLIINEDALEALAKKAIEYKAGARGIKKAFDDILGSSEYDILSNTTPKEIIITKEAVEDPKKLLLKY